MVLDGPINGDWFEAYVMHILAPTLRPGDVVIMDNLSSHKRASVREIIEDHGAELRFLPPYSPDFNPIEMAFAKLKALLRKAAERTVDGLWAAIGRLVDVFTCPLNLLSVLLSGRRKTPWDDHRQRSRRRRVMPRARWRSSV
jgi:transposase